MPEGRFSNPSLVRSRNTKSDYFRIVLQEMWAFYISRTRTGQKKVEIDRSLLSFCA
jgi:hypothetical protein